MTPDLLAQLRKALEFDETRWHPHDHIPAERENARLQPVHEALVSCVEALLKYCSMKATIKTLDGFEPIDWQLTPAGEALSRLRAAVEG